MLLPYHHRYFYLLFCVCFYILLWRPPPLLASNSFGGLAPPCFGPALALVLRGRPSFASPLPLPVWHSPKRERMALGHSGDPGVQSKARRKRLHTRSEL